MSALKIIKKDESLIQVLSNAGSFALKAKDDALEVVHIEAKAGKSLFLQPYECENAMYLFYFLEGRVAYAKENCFLGPGDCISAKDLTETEYFEIVEDVKMLLVTQKDFFDKQANYVLKMTAEMDKIQAKDQYTEKHCNRSGNLALRIGLKFGLKNDQINDLVFASKIHDLGKIQVPLHILNKPGTYTYEEFDVMKKHPRAGYDIIVDSVSQREALIVLQHHEKCDGTGYPQGLKKDEMLIESRILAVADAFDALTTHRPYRVALSQSEAFKLLKKDSGRLWDSDVLEALEMILCEL